MWKVQRPIDYDNLKLVHLSLSSLKTISYAASCPGILYVYFFFFQLNRAFVVLECSLFMTGNVGQTKDNGLIKGTSHMASNNSSKLYSFIQFVSCSNNLIFRRSALKRLCNQIKALIKRKWVYPKMRYLWVIEICRFTIRYLPEMYQSLFPSPQRIVCFKQRSFVI